MPGFCLLVIQIPIFKQFLSYYENIKSKFKELNFRIEHPEKGNEEEHIELSIDISTTESIISTSEIFTYQILPDYLKGIRK